MTKAILAIIYNHRYDANIPILDRLYQDRFSRVFHLVPFYQGTAANVVPVYENSFRFQGYLAQSFKYLRETEAEHIVFAADDLILNPRLNESNITESLNIVPDGSYIDAYPFSALTWCWPNAQFALRFPECATGAEGRRYLPAYQEAFDLLARHFENFSTAIRRRVLYRSPRDLFYSGLTIRRFPRIFLRYLLNKPAFLPYPLVMGYSDFFVVARESLEPLAHYCGLFAAMNLFAEIALPTALLFSSSRVKTRLPANLSKGDIWDPATLENLKSRHENRLDLLLKDFPDKAYLHPIKLSQWS